MDLKTIKQVIDLMTKAELTEFELEEDNFKLRLCRKGNGTATEYYHPAPPVVHSAAVAGAPATTSAQPAAAEPEDKSMTVIKSPMVGTFYRSPSPDSATFADVGSKVTPETTVCIIEAMKVMNEIVAEVGGTITEVLIENGESVEYGQPLFKVKKA